ncbi:MAG: hypothetical protein AVDCRST_MAG93-3956 [uncultured Chloroflexia bacterium]|uniref:Uncharacterized protein n=1 Tax=uncultured Chloroflexia bacterium TaxID=1672391 RepID=A0A6J4K094_9CHLR|nr:MAG: hypothetical protein AVDCRST_MAG93-3956 [uncultured Chloroflexia bacterium]
MVKGLLWVEQRPSTGAGNEWTGRDMDTATDVLAASVCRSQRLTNVADHLLSPPGGGKPYTRAMCGVFG